jgi:hypothetical protein
VAIDTLLDWVISNVDIDSAFLHGNIDTEVYIELPEGDEKTRRGPINATIFFPQDFSEVVWSIEQKKPQPWPQHQE